MPKHGMGLLLLGTALLVGGLISFDPPYMTENRGGGINHHSISYPTWARFGITAGAVLVVGSLLLYRRHPPN